MSFRSLVTPTFLGPRVAVRVVKAPDASEIDQAFVAPPPADAVAVERFSRVVDDAFGVIVQQVEAEERRFSRIEEKAKTLLAAATTTTTFVLASAAATIATQPKLLEGSVAPFALGSALVVALLGVAAAESAMTAIRIATTGKMIDPKSIVDGAIVRYSIEHSAAEYKVFLMKNLFTIAAASFARNEEKAATVVRGQDALFAQLRLLALTLFVAVAAQVAAHH